MPRQTRTAAGGLTLALTLAALPLYAQTAPEALIEQGVQQRELGHDDAALDLFRQAWASGHGARARAQMGLAEQALGRWVEAEAHLREALAAGSDRWIRHNRAALDRALGVIGQHLGALEVRGNVPGAEVRVGGAAVATLPMAAPVRVASGTLPVEVRAAGYYPVVRSVVVPPGGLVREAIDLAAVPPASAAPALVPAPRAATVTAPGAPGSPGAPGGHDTGVAPGPLGGGTQRALAWTAAGGAVAVLAGAVAAQLAREAAVGRFNDDGRCLLDNGLDRGQNCASDRSTFQTAGALAIAGYVLGGGLAVTSVVLFATAHADRGVHARSGCGAGPGTVGVACGVVF